MAKGRGLDVENVGRLADGRIFTGEQAADLGIIDELGNFEDAVRLATQMAGLQKRPKLIYDEKEASWWTSLFGNSGRIRQIWPDWSKQPMKFQYLYLPLF